MRRLVFALGFTFFFLTPFFSVMVLQSFPFRGVKKGSQIPDVVIKSIDGKEFSLRDICKNVAVILFWGADSEIKKKHSIDAMRALQEIGDRFGGNVTIVAIDSQGDPIEVIKNATQEAGFTYPVYIDADRSAYGAFGVFVMPSVAVVKNCVVTEGIGYTHNLGELVSDEVEVALGIKTREEIEEERKSKVAEKSKERLEAERLLNLAVTMAKKGMVDAALDSAKKAVSADPNYGEAYIELAWIYLESGKVDEAEKALSKGLELSPDSFRGALASARIKALKGDYEGAINDLRLLMFKNPRSPELYFMMGEVYESMKRFEDAASAYRKAYELMKEGCER